MNEGFITQTAIDYDLDVDIVRDIANKHPNDFYNELEIYIKNRP